MSWGECARSADLQIDRHSLRVDLRLERAKDNRLGRYASLRKAKVQPANTTIEAVRHAEEHGSVREVTVTNPQPLVREG